MTATYISGSRTQGTDPVFTLTLTPEPWVAEAKCAEIGGDDHFSDGKGHQYTQARMVCQACPAIRDCGLYALRNRITEGMWGGMTPYERAQILRKAKR